MNSIQWAQIAAAIIAASTPWCVVMVVRTVVSHQARSFQASFISPSIISVLGWVTLAVLPIVAVIAVFLPAPSLLMTAISLCFFAALSIIGVRALQRIYQASRAWREVPTNVREASLRTRHLNDYLPFAWRGVFFAATIAGLGVFAKRLATPVPGRNLLVPTVFALSAPLFLLLYETLMKELVTGGRAADESLDEKRQRTVRKVFGVEVLLVSTLLGVAHAILNANWLTEGVWVSAAIVVAGCVGLVGCALALSSIFMKRSYTIAPD
jgi:hypothetical protein